jgi:hypothetical protein
MKHQHPLYLPLLHSCLSAGRLTIKKNAVEVSQRDRCPIISYRLSELWTKHCLRMKVCVALHAKLSYNTNVEGHTCRWTERPLGT